MSGLVLCCAIPVCKVRAMFLEADALIGTSIFAAGKIIVSNDINEDVLQSLNHSENSIDVFGRLGLSLGYTSTRTGVVFPSDSDCVILLM